MRLPRILLSFFILILSPYLIFAGTTGKIVGVVTDATTGEKLISANIVLEGTTMGASTNVNGYFAILNVAPGTYKLKATLLGYTSGVMLNVRVDIDQTTTANFKLREQAVEGQEIVVVAERPVVQRDISASRANISSIEVEKLPTANVASVIGLQAGVQRNTAGEFVIRGGTSDQTLVMINGLALRDGRDNVSFSNISINSVENIQVQTGGWNAEYGNVRSGLVNVVTKEGKKAGYNFGMVARYSPTAPKHFGPSIYDRNSYWVRPYVDSDVAWTGTKNGNWNAFTQLQYPEFEGWNAISLKTLQDNDPSNDLTPEAAQRLFLFQHRKQAAISQPDFDFDLGFGGPVPGVSEYLGDLRFFASFRRAVSMYLIPLSRDRWQDYSGQLKMTSDLGDGLKLSAEGFISETNGTNDNNSGLPGVFTSPGSITSQMNRVSYIDARIFSSDYWAPTTIKRLMVGAKLTHVLSPSTFYEVSLNRVESKYFTAPGAPRDTTKRFKFGNSFYSDEGPFGFWPQPTTGIEGMRMSVGFSNSRDSSVVQVWTARGSISSQVDQYNQLQAGVEIVYADNNVNYASVDEFLPSGRSRSQWHTFPIQGAAYLQDKLEFEGMIANLGVRLDYSHAGGSWYIYDQYNTALTSAKSLGIDTLLQSEPTKKIVTLSPRVGVAFPITENAKLFFNYGHFNSLPNPENLFLVRRFSDNNAVTRLADPNLPLPRTIQYELGYEHSLMDQFLGRVAAYYKDVTQETKLVRYTSRDTRVNYQVSTSNQYRDIRGFELTLSKNRGNWVQGFINYTYDVRTNGFFGSDIYYENAQEQRNYNRINIKQEKPIPQPYARANIDFYTPPEFGPTLFGHSLLGDWRLNLVGSWSSGFYFTWAGGGSAPPGLSNNVQWADSWNADMRFSKNFKIGRANFQFFVDIANVFNIRNMSTSGFVDGKDYDAYLRSLHLPEEIAGGPSNPKFGYINYPGNDRPGDYRTVPYEPYDPNDPDEARKQRILDTKAYIDMPNLDTFNFLNPRDVFYGIRLSFDL